MSSIKSRLVGSTWAPVTALYLLAVLVYVLLGRGQQIPLVTPDEFTYAGLARSLAHGHGFQAFGAPVPVRSALYVFLLVPSWALASNVDAYALAKATSAVLVCAVVFPVWLLARRDVSGRVALLPAALAISGTWMVSASLILTENLAYPLATATLCATVAALHGPGGRWGWWAIGLAALTSAARLQLVVLFVVVLAAIAIDLALAGEARRERFAAWRTQLVVLGTILLAGLLAVLVSGSGALGFYSDVRHFSPSAGDLASALWKQTTSLATMSGVIPFAALLAAASSPRCWRDERLRALLIVALTTSVVVIAQSAWFDAGLRTTHAIQRYVEYALPLMFVLLVVALARGALGWQRLAIAGGLTTLALLRTPALDRVIEERAVYSVWVRMNDLLGTSTRASVGIFALLLVAAAITLAWRLRPATASLAIAGLVLAALLFQSQAAWNWQLDLSRAFRAQFPADLAWVDHHASGRATRIFAFGNSPLTDTALFFNEDVEQTLVPRVKYVGRAPLGAVCGWGVADGGVLRIDPSCAPLGSALWNNDPLLRLNIKGANLRGRDPLLGQVFELHGRARLLAAIVLPCNLPTLAVSSSAADFHQPDRADVSCNPALTINTWLERRGTLVVHFRGGAGPQQVQSSEGTTALPAGALTDVRIPIAAGPVSTPLQIDWASLAGAPRITGIDVRDARGTTPLL